MPSYAAQVSVWEKESFYRHRDIIIVGGGLSGLWSAYHLKKKNPSLSIAIVERGLIPAGASTRNAGFACFGSVTELHHDLLQSGEEKMLRLVEMRYQGLRMISKLFRAEEIDFELCGGYELIDTPASGGPGDLHAVIGSINRILAGTSIGPDIFSLQNQKIQQFGFGNTVDLVFNQYEGSLHSGKLCELLTRAVNAMGVTILNGINVHGYTKSGDRILLHTEQSPDLTASRLLVCNNAFAKRLLPDLDIAPARGQILVTDEIPGLRFNGCFHALEGYYYFRNLGNRILLGGARNTDIAGETTDSMTINDSIQASLETFLKTRIIPGLQFNITDRWSGIMGMGTEKLPIVEELSANVFCCVRMSGMGVALTPVAGQMVADMMEA